MQDVVTKFQQGVSGGGVTPNAAEYLADCNVDRLTALGCIPAYREWLLLFEDLRYRGCSPDVAAKTALELAADGPAKATASRVLTGGEVLASRGPFTFDAEGGVTLSPGSYILNDPLYFSMNDGTRIRGVMYTAPGRPEGATTE